MVTISLWTSFSQCGVHNGGMVFPNVEHTVVCLHVNSYPHRGPLRGYCRPHWGCTPNVTHVGVSPRMWSTLGMLRTSPMWSQCGSFLLNPQLATYPQCGEYVILRRSRVSIITNHLRHTRILLLMMSPQMQGTVLSSNSRKMLRIGMKNP